jgi:flagellar basal body-associated protein FliL
MKRIIVIVVLLILVGGGGAGALIMLGILPNPFNPAKPMTAAEQAAAKADAEAKAKAFKPPTEIMTFVDMRDMIIPVVSANKVERTVYMSVRLHVVKDQKDAVQNTIVRYENAVIDQFVPYFQTYFTKHEILNLREIKTKLNAMAKKLYGDKVQDVLLVNIFEQKFGSLN